MQRPRGHIIGATESSGSVFFLTLTRDWMHRGLKPVDEACVLLSPAAHGEGVP